MIAPHTGRGRRLSFSMIPSHTGKRGLTFSMIVPHTGRGRAYI